MNASRTTSAYNSDLAYIHDVGFGDHARHAAEFLIQQLRRKGIHSGLVIDLGCGSGILAQRVAEAGYDFLGVDISPNMIAIAEKRVPSGRFRVGSFLSAKLEPCVAVTAIGECFNYLFDKRTSERTLETLFGRVHKALMPGGVFVFDIAEHGRAGKSGTRQSVTTGDDWAVIATVRELQRGILLEREITTFRKVGRWYRRDRETHYQRLLDHRGLSVELRASGFRVKVLRGYGQIRFPGGITGLIARKLARLD